MTQEEKFDYNLLLTFLWQVHAFEELLKKAGFRRAGKPEEADWLGFVGMVHAGEIEVKPDDESVMRGVMYYLLVQPMQSRSKYTIHEMIQVAELLQERGRQFLRYPEGRDYGEDDYTMMISGLVVLPAWQMALVEWMRTSPPSPLQKERGDCGQE